MARAVEKVRGPSRLAQVLEESARVQGRRALEEALAFRALWRASRARRVQEAFTAEREERALAVLDLAEERAQELAAAGAFGRPAKTRFMEF